jgi:hypothetical protein
MIDCLLFSISFVDFILIFYLINSPCSFNGFFLLCQFWIKNSRSIAITNFCYACLSTYSLKLLQYSNATNNYACVLVYELFQSY